MTAVAPTTHETIRVLLSHLIGATEVDGIVAFKDGDKMQAFQIYGHDYTISLSDPWSSDQCIFTCQHEYVVSRAAFGMPRHVVTDRSRWELVIDGETHTFFMRRREDLDNSDRVEPYEQSAEGRLLVHHRSIENHQGKEL